MIAKMCKDATMMGNVWISVLLYLSLAAWQVEGRGGRGGGGGGGAIDDTDVFLIMMLGLVGITCFACCSCCMSCSNCSKSRSAISFTSRDVVNLLCFIFITANC